MSPNIKISKALTWLLRHGAKQNGLSVDQQGFVPIDQVIEYFKTRSDDPINLDVKIISSIVAGDKKTRFKIEGNLIRCNQGHSFELELAYAALVILLA